jgi:pimeloyl-ACP methyl ester carboxylesterase
VTTTTANGITLRYEDVGEARDGDAALLFHHGYGSSGDRWDSLTERLRDRYRCVSWDARGTGQSERPAHGYTPEDLTADTLGLADGLGLARFTFVGHSMGGAVGYLLGLDHAERLEKLVLMAPVPSDGIEIPEEQRRARLDLWYARDREAMIAQGLLYPARPRSREEVERGVERELAVSEEHVLESLEAMSAMRLGDRLGEITTPTLVVAGAADSLLSHNLADFGRLGNATLHVFSRVGHGISSEVPSAMARVLPDFLEHGVVTAATLAARAAEASRAASS